MLFKVEAEGDVLYIKADDGRDVPDIVRKWMGPIPEGVYEVTQIDKLPAGVEVLE